MSASFDESKRLHEANAKLKRQGKRIGEYDSMDQVKHCAGELVELAYEISMYNCEYNSEKVIARRGICSEISDVMNLMDSVAHKWNIAEDEIEAAKLKKLKERFTEE